MGENKGLILASPEAFVLKRRPLPFQEWGSVHEYANSPYSFDMTPVMPYLSADSLPCRKMETIPHGPQHVETQ